MSATPTADSMNFRRQAATVAIHVLRLQEAVEEVAGRRVPGADRARADLLDAYQRLGQAHAALGYALGKAQTVKAVSGG